MTIAAQIVDELGGPTKLKEQTGIPIQTIWDWKRNGNIPHWRRSTVLDAAQRLNKALTPEMTAYLASRDPAPRGEAGVANHIVSADAKTCRSGESEAA
jgi:hypothetical protein